MACLGRIRCPVISWALEKARRYGAILSGGPAVWLCTLGGKKTRRWPVALVTVDRPVESWAALRPVIRVRSWPEPVVLDGELFRVRAGGAQPGRWRGCRSARAG